MQKYYKTEHQRWQAPSNQTGRFDEEDLFIASEVVPFDKTGGLA